MYCGTVNICIIHMSKFKSETEKFIVNRHVLWQELNLGYCDAGAIPIMILALIIFYRLFQPFAFFKTSCRIGILSYSQLEGAKSNSSYLNRQYFCFDIVHLQTQHNKHQSVFNSHHRFKTKLINKGGKQQIRES